MNEYITKIYKNENKEIEVKIDLDNNVWLTREQISELFDKSSATITYYLKKETNSVCQIFQHTGTDDKVYKVKHYSLDLILKIGYKIDVDITLKFNDWVKEILKELDNENSQKWLPIEVFEDGEFKLEVSVSPKEETVWLTQEQIAKLYLTSKQLISFHANNIIKEHELEEATVKKNLTVQIENEREVKREILNYNLDMIISIGYRVNSSRGIMFRRWANKILKQYLTKGYSIDESRVTLYKENYLELSNTVLRLENKIIIHDEEIELLKDKLTNKEQTEKIFFQGQLYDAYSFLIKIIKKANYKIILIDNYIDIKTLDILSNRNEEVNIEIITKTNTLTNLSIANFNKQYGNLTIKTNNTFHDRFLIIDDKEIYLCGGSIKDAGKKTFGIIKMSNESCNDALVKI